MGLEILTTSVFAAGFAFGMIVVMVGFVAQAIRSMFGPMDLRGDK